MKAKDFKTWMMGLEKLTKAQRDKLLTEVDGEYHDPAAGLWRDSDSPTTEFRAMTSF
jgi:hypothetical protein